MEEHHSVRRRKKGTGGPGHVHNIHHFTGKKAGKQKRHKKRRNGSLSLTRKQRKQKRCSHKNRYRS